MGEIIYGKPVVDSITEDMTIKVESLKTRGISPKLTIVRVGENPSEIAYEKGAIKKCESIGIAVDIITVDNDIAQPDFISELYKLNRDPSVNGIMVLRPLPKQLDEKVIKHAIMPGKDVDCFNSLNLVKVMENDEEGFAPCTPCAVIEILKHYKVPMKGKNVVVVGASMVVGRPTSMLLLNENATVTVCHIYTQNLSKMTSKADIVVIGIGVPKFINSSYIKEGAVVIDVGINLCEDGKICGDVDTEDVKNKAKMVTPAPGGVGSVTTSVLAMHVVKACHQQNKM